MIHKLVRRNFEILWSRALHDASRNVIMGAVARAVVAAILASVGNRHAAKMSAHSEDNKPVSTITQGNATNTAFTKRNNELNAIFLNHERISLEHHKEMHEPLGILDTLSICLLVAELRHNLRVCLRDFGV